MAKITINGLNVKATKNNSWYVGIFTKDKEGNEVWINGFVDNHPQWQKGDVVELDIFMEEYQGVNRLKFNLPEGTEVKCPNGNPPNLTTDGAMKLNNLEVALKALELRVLFLEGKDTTTYDINALKGANTASEAMMEAETKPGETIIENDDGSITKMPF